MRVLNPGVTPYRVSPLILINCRPLRKVTKMKRKILKHLLYAGTIGLMSILPNLSFGQNNHVPPYKTKIENGIVTFATKEEGEKAMKAEREELKIFLSQLKTAAAELPANMNHPMFWNYFVGAHNTDFATDKNFYGSGDVDGNGIINIQDYNSTITGTNPFNDGTYRGDADLDGVSGTAADKQIILEYIQGTRTQINMWELETKAEQRIHLTKALAIDPTNLIKYHSNDENDTGWLCYNFTNQLFINFNGVYDITNSIFGQNNGTNLQYDLSHNGIFRIPLRNLGTIGGYPTQKVEHEINFVYNSDKGNENVKNLDMKIKIEPQSDEIFYGNSNFSMDPNEYAKEKWYGYYKNMYVGWKYGTFDLYSYTLSNGLSTLIENGVDSYIAQAWNPFDKTGVEGKIVSFPADKNLENVSGIEDVVADYIATEKPSDLLYYNETQVKKTSSSNQAASGAGKYNFDVDILWELTAGAYNPQNTPAAMHNQKIKVRDTQPPVYNSVSKTFTDASGSPVTIITSKDTTNKSCDGLVGTARELKKGVDATGNQSLEVLVSEANFDNRIMPVYVSSPANIDYIGNPNGANPLPSETGALPYGATQQVMLLCITLMKQLENPMEKKILKEHILELPQDLIVKDLEIQSK